MNTTKTRRINLYTIVSAIVNLFTVGAAAISFSHIIHSAAILGVTNWQAYTVPFFIDGLAILGMIGRSAGMLAQIAARLAAQGRTPEEIAAAIESIRRFAFRLQIAAGILSLAANIHAGNNLGEQLFGVLVVTGFVVCEKFAEKLRAHGPVKTTEAAPQITQADMQAYADAGVTAALTQARAEFAIALDAAVKTAVTDALAADAANRKREADKAKRRERAEARKVELAAQLSPATVNEIESSYPAPASAYEPAYL